MNPSVEIECPECGKVNCCGLVRTRNGEHVYEINCDWGEMTPSEFDELDITWRVAINDDKWGLVRTGTLARGDRYCEVGDEVFRVEWVDGVGGEYPDLVETQDNTLATYAGDSA